MRQKIDVKQVDLQTIVDQIELNGPLANRGLLWQAVTDQYNTAAEQAVSVALVTQRAKAFKLTCKTPMGKKGKQGKLSPEAKQKLLAALHGSKSGPRKSRGAKLKSKPKFAAHIARLRKITPEQYQPLIDKLVKGKLTAAIKLTCLLCVCFDRKEVNQCTGLSCPIFLFRPYQKNVDETDEDDAPESTEVPDADADAN